MTIDGIQVPFAGEDDELRAGDAVGVPASVSRRARRIRLRARAVSVRRRRVGPRPRWLPRQVVERGAIDVGQHHALVVRPDRPIRIVVEQCASVVDAGQDPVDAAGIIERDEAAIGSNGVSAHAVPGAGDVPRVVKNKTCARLLV